ncbi:MAG: GxxExxY protein [Bacteroidales bacterium]|nr:GxxExxY protein [Bacteroidales bacterium]
MYDFGQYRDTVYSIIGASMEVHKHLGHGLLEAVYAEALKIELNSIGIDCELEKEVLCYYKDHLLEKKYRIDLAVGDICVELKSVSELDSAHRAQLFNYLRLTQMPIGLLINFGSRKLEGERYAYVEEENECFLINKNMDILDEY